MENFDIPIVLFTFKRLDKTLEVLEVIAKVKPKKIYILSDQGRNSDEQLIVNKLRKEIELRIDWECELIKNYATENRGVYENIGEGSKWVLNREKWAIFLEDDNLPDISFFYFCKSMLEYYENEKKILWICGTNYLKEYKPNDDASYIFTSHMLPCGWASWSDKFLKYYDGNLKLWKNKETKNKLLSSNIYRPLLKQDFKNWDRELDRIERGLKPDSWDYQMALSLKANELYGIVPKYNLIKNIGVDLDSIHGGNSYELEMTRRFCNIPTKSLEFPLVHPLKIQIDPDFETLNAKIITLPFKDRLKGSIASFFKKVLGMNDEDSIIGTIKNTFLFSKK
ncbi:hemolytic protein HlpA [Elizabethkingia meningoseptica]|uniref:hemolytic protein HlpA n=1 Tax=Elizabethkingia meningoseptica TaxID=238 RepID=UPI0009992DB1|nr:hemolytic protein HlpA [Elizabethkingia meningoseptica]OPB97079.1 hemolytic protein HlpA [Elizabethkingia meningoseptica]